jgi:hypothetical protein
VSVACGVLKASCGRLGKWLHKPGGTTRSDGCWRQDHCFKLRNWLQAAAVCFQLTCSSFSSWIGCCSLGTGHMAGDNSRSSAGRCPSPAGPLPTARATCCCLHRLTGHSPAGLLPPATVGRSSGCCSWSTAILCGVQQALRPVCKRQPTHSGVMGCFCHAHATARCAAQTARAATKRGTTTNIYACPTNSCKTSGGTQLTILG